MSRWAELGPLSPGEPAPLFAAPTDANATVRLSNLAGRHVLLAFMPGDPTTRAKALKAFTEVRPRFDDGGLTAVFVSAESPDVARPADPSPGQRWVFDADRSIAKLYGAIGPEGAETPYWMLLDPLLRVLDRAPITAPESLFARIAALPPADVQAAAPVLIVPRVFDAGLCQRLIGLHDARGGQASGLMVDDQPGLRREIVARMGGALIPMVARALQFSATRLERYLVACQDVGGAVLPPHRGNDSLETAHRRFAVSINLNAEAHDGGDLRFPEFGARTYRAPTGGAVVFCCSLLHDTTPITRGRRHAFLPFLYDEAGQRIREQNLALSEGPGDATAPAGR